MKQVLLLVMLIAAAADLLRSGRMTLDIIGDGPMLGDLIAQAKSLGCETGLTFHKWIDHSEVQTLLSKSHILSFPSIREFGGGVVLEAMALGVVPEAQAAAAVLGYNFPGSDWYEDSYALLAEEGYEPVRPEKGWMARMMDKVANAF